MELGLLNGRRSAFLGGAAEGDGQKKIILNQDGFACLWGSENQTLTGWKAKTRYDEAGLAARILRAGRLFRANGGATSLRIALPLEHPAGMLSITAAAGRKIGFGVGWREGHRQR